MCGKPYGLGIIVGRFQTLHTGHVEMISAALAICDRVGVFVGSSQESMTANNPFSYEIRKKLIRNVFSDSVSVNPLPDIGVGNTSKWGEYVLENTRECFGRLPDVFVSGKESRRSDWLSGECGKSIAELYVPKTIEISASEMRRLLIEDRRAEWESLSPEQNHALYGELREIVLASMDNTQTASI